MHSDGTTPYHGPGQRSAFGLFWLIDFRAVFDVADSSVHRHKLLYRHTHKLRHRPVVCDRFFKASCRSALIASLIVCIALSAISGLSIANRLGIIPFPHSSFPSSRCGIRIRRHAGARTQQFGQLGDIDGEAAVRRKSGSCHAPSDFVLE
jgi:hypothetical protein